MSAQNSFQVEYLCPTPGHALILFALSPLVLFASASAQRTQRTVIFDAVYARNPSILFTSMIQNNQRSRSEGSAVRSGR